MHNTGNELESNDILDFSDNCENLDVLMNADQEYWTDRLGNKRPTIDYALRMAGFTPAGFDFTTGGVLKNGDRNKCVFNQADQTWYSWSGDLPYNVIAGSTPGEGWKVVNRNALTIAREALRRTYQEVGLNLVEGSFEEGGTLQSVTDVILEEKTGKVYSWSGSFPKVVNKGLSVAGFTPVSGQYRNSEIPVEYLGISINNTPEKNTEILERVRFSGIAKLLFQEGVYPFDVFRTNGIKNIVGTGRDKTVITVTCKETPVGVQISGTVITGVHLKSVAGSLEWQRIEMRNSSKLSLCKVSGFLHNSPSPNAWGLYFKDSVRCSLDDVEFENNSQSDIAILEGTEYLSINKCFHTTNSLVINFEPNNNINPLIGCEINQSQVKKLLLLNNDLSNENDYCVTIKNCQIYEVFYDGLGVEFFNTLVTKFKNKPDNLSRSYIGRLNGVPVGPEVLKDPYLTTVATGAGVNSGWKLRYSTIVPAERYTRASDGSFQIGRLNQPSSVHIYSEPFNVTPGDSLLVTFNFFISVLPQSNARPDHKNIEFFNSAGEVVGSTKLSSRLPGSGFKVMSGVVLVPENAVTAKITITNSDTASVYQEVRYRCVSVKKIGNFGDINTSMMFFQPFPRVVKIGLTKTKFDEVQYYYCPLPVGTIVEFDYESTKLRYAEVITATEDPTLRLGTLRPISNYI